MERQIFAGIFAVAAVMSASHDAFGLTYNVEASVIAQGGDLYSEGIFVSDGYLMWTQGDGRFWGYDLAAGEQFLIEDGYLDTASLLVDDNYLIWQTMDSGVKVYDLDAHQAFLTAETDADFWSLKVADGYAVWRDMAVGLTHACDLATRQTFLVDTAGVTSMIETWLAGGYFLFTDDSGALRGYDLKTRSIFVICALPSEGIRLSPGGRYAVYCAWNIDGIAVLFGYDLDARQYFLISQEFFDTSSAALSDRFLVYNDTMNMQLRAFDLQSRTDQVIADQNPWMIRMAPQGDFVIWMDPADMGLRGYDLSSGTAFVLTDKYVDEWSVGFYGDHIVWMESDPMGLVAFDLASHEQYVVYRSWNMEIMERSREWRSDRYIGWREYINEGTRFIAYDLRNRQRFTLCEGELGVGPILHDDYVVWTTYDSTSDTSRLMGGPIYCLVNDQCTEAAEVTEDAPYAGDSTGASGNDQSSCAYNDWRDVWHVYRPAAGGPVTVNVDSGAFDTTLSVFDACGNHDLACNDDRDLDSTDSRLSFDAVKGKAYLIRVAGFDGQSGPYNLTVSRGECAEPVRSDLDGDCRVNMTDLAIFAADWLRCGLQPAEDCN